MYAGMISRLNRKNRRNTREVIEVSKSMMCVPENRTVNCFP